MLHIPNLKVLQQRAAPRLEKYQTFILQPNTQQSLGRALVSICRSQVLLECGYSPPKIWKLLPEWSQDLITGSCFPQIAFTPTLIEHDCSETRNDSVIVAYRPAYKPALWPGFCENVSGQFVWISLCPTDLPSLSLSPSRSLSLMQRVDWIQHSSVQLTSCYTWAGGWGVSVYSWIDVERCLHLTSYNYWSWIHWKETKSLPF